MKGLLVVIVLGLLSSCSFREDKLKSPDATLLRPWFTNLRETLFRPKCSECHAGPGSRGGDLMEYQSLLRFIEKGKPENSPLYLSLTGAGGDMPLGRAPLSQKEVKMIYDWIAAQAPVDGEETPPPPPPPPEPEPTWKYIRENIIPGKCFNCHKGPGSDAGVNLDNYEDFANDKTILVKGDPDNSLLYDVVRTDFMPYKDSRPKLTVEEKKLIFDWILKGAPKEEGQ